MTSPGGESRQNTCGPGGGLSGRALRPFLLLALIVAGGVQAAELTVAVASNFHPAMTEIAARFSAETGQDLVLSSGSTGKHYAQIRHGAPFDVFFAADRARPARLEREGLGVAETRFTYALGQLVLWSPKPDLVDDQGGVLGGDGFRRLAIANPRLAPYGQAAREVLERLDLWTRLQPRLVRGESVGQAFQFVRSGNAELGLVAVSQVFRPGTEFGGSHWRVPAELHAPIEQQVLLLRDTVAGRALLGYVRGPVGRAVILAHGYGLAAADAASATAGEPPR